MIEDISIDNIKKFYSLGFFASGYESRSDEASRRLVELGIRFRLIVIYNYLSGIVATGSTLADNAKRIAENILFINSQDELVSLLSNELSSARNNGAVFVDYSSMRRNIYASILCAFRNLNANAQSIDLWYTHARYNGDFTPLVINDITAVECSRYSGDPVRKNAVFLGLGFDSVSPVSVCELLEPDIIIPFVSVCSPDPSNDERVMSVNKLFLESIERSPIAIPISQTAGAFQILLENIVYLIGNHNCILVPMGPKTHVLACVLLSLVCDGVSCLHVSGRREMDVNAFAFDKHISIARIMPDSRVTDFQ